MVQDDDGFVTGCILMRQLDVGENPSGVRLSDEEWSALVRGLQREAVSVDHAHTFVHRIDTECVPGEVKEAH